jgi:phage host-nuclease inhibitor protein Gam
MITIEGLNKRQRMLADIIWALDSKEQVTDFIRTLPDVQKKEAIVVTQMMVLAFIDQIETVDDEVVELIDNLRRA